MTSITKEFTVNRYQEVFKLFSAEVVPIEEIKKNFIAFDQRKHQICQTINMYGDPYYDQEGRMRAIVRHGQENNVTGEIVPTILITELHLCPHSGMEFMHYEAGKSLVVIDLLAKKTLFSTPIIYDPGERVKSLLGYLNGEFQEIVKNTGKE